MQHRQVAPERGHHPDARIRVAEAGVDVHAADEESVHVVLEGHRETFVALARRRHLRLPRSEGMGGGGHQRRAVALRRLEDDAPGLAQRLAELRDRGAHPRVGLDLRAQQLADDLVRPRRRLARLEEGGVRVGQQVARNRIDEEELLLDPKGDGAVPGIAHGQILRSFVPKST